MDIRLRVLLACIPLVLLTIILAIAIPLVNDYQAQLTSEQITATDNLTDAQNIEVLIIRQSDALQRMIAGQSIFSGQYYTQRQQIQALIDRHQHDPGTDAQVAHEIAAQYSLLLGIHDRIITYTRQHDTTDAQGIFDREADQTASLLLSSTDIVLDRNRQTLSSLNSEVHNFIGQTLAILAVGLIGGALVVLVLVWLLLLQLVRPIERLSDDAVRYADGALHGQLSSVGNITQLQRLRTSFQYLLDVSHSRQSALEQTQTDLEQRLAQEQYLRETVQALRVPVIPLPNSMILLPLIGYVDRVRADDLLRILLEAIPERNARTAILDVSGLVMVDRSTASALQAIISAARLLGCQVILVGVRHDQALLLLDAGLMGTGLQTARDIPEVLAAASVSSHPALPA